MAWVRRARAGLAVTLGSAPCRHRPEDLRPETAVFRCEPPSRWLVRFVAVARISARSHRFGSRKTGPPEPFPFPRLRADPVQIGWRVHALFLRPAALFGGFGVVSVARASQNWFHLRLRTHEEFETHGVQTTAATVVKMRLITKTHLRPAPTRRYARWACWILLPIVIRASGSIRL